VKRVAVIGAGISGIAAAHLLGARHHVTLIEASSRLGGHTDTHEIPCDGETLRVDSGFIVFNRPHYPRFNAWLEDLGVASQPSDMSFGVSDAGAGIEYGTRNVRALFAQPKNLVDVRFLGMLRDLVRFYRQRVLPLAPEDGDATLGDYLLRHRYGAAFREQHLLPMCAALWSQPIGPAEMLPIRHVLSFMAHHGMLSLGRRPRWRTVVAGSSAYVEAFRQRFHGEILINATARSVRREPACVRVVFDRGEREFDDVFLACHSDEALALLERPTADERAVLGAMAYRRNRVVVHSDARVMPKRRAAWSSWNVVSASAARRFAVTYWMNRLQSLQVRPPILVTVDPAMPIDEHLVYVERTYSHPVFTREALRAQLRKPRIDGADHVYYCGAYWGWGFHEDGFASAVSAVEAHEAREETHRAA